SLLVSLLPHLPLPPFFPYTPLFPSHRCPPLALADRRLLFPGWSRRRQLLPRHHDGPLWEKGGSTPRPPCVSDRVPGRLRVRASPHRRSRTAGALLAHAGAGPDLPADDQGVLSDVDRLMGAASVQRVRVPDVCR